jgi:hypothetical protein
MKVDFTKFPHPAYGHLLPLKVTGEGYNRDLPSPAFCAGEGARRADEGQHPLTPPLLRQHAPLSNSASISKSPS